MIIFLSSGQIILVVKYAFPLSTTRVTYIVGGSYWRPCLKPHWQSKLNRGQDRGAVYCRHYLLKEVARGKNHTQQDEYSFYSLDVPWMMILVNHCINIQYQTQGYQSHFTDKGGADTELVIYTLAPMGYQ